MEPLEISKLTTEQNNYLDSEITLEELGEVIKALPTDKVPWPDGFAAEFFRSYATELAPLLLEVFNFFFFKNGKLRPTMAQARISLMFKKDKDPSECKSYLPISLIQVDVKILSNTLANRLSKVMTDLIHVDQVGFIRGRSSSDNIRRFINIMWSASCGQW